MKSTIKIEMDFDANQPVIEIYCDATSTDLRDKTLKRFLDTFGHDSSWAKFHFSENYSSNSPVAYIRPLTRADFKKEGKAMLEQHRLNALNNVHGTPVDETEWVPIHNNSKGFLKLLDEKGIKWEQNGHSTLVDASTDLFTLGQDLQKAMSDS